MSNKLPATDEARIAEIRREMQKPLSVIRANENKTLDNERAELLVQKYAECYALCKQILAIHLEPDAYGKPKELNVVHWNDLTAATQYGAYSGQEQDVLEMIAAHKPLNRINNMVEAFNKFERKIEIHANRNQMIEALTLLSGQSELELYGETILVLMDVDKDKVGDIWLAPDSLLSQVGAQRSKNQVRMGTVIRSGHEAVVCEGQRVVFKRRTDIYGNDLQEEFVIDPLSPKWLTLAIYRAAPGYPDILGWPLDEKGNPVIIDIGETFADVRKMYDDQKADSWEAQPSEVRKATEPMDGVLNERARYWENPNRRKKSWHEIKGIPEKEWRKAGTRKSQE